MRSYSTAYGPDLRLGVVSGPGELSERARVLRTFGSGWTSRILQDALAHPLTDPATTRRVPVADETSALVTRAARGVTVSPGSRFGPPRRSRRAQGAVTTAVPPAPAVIRPGHSPRAASPLRICGTAPTVLW